MTSTVLYYTLVAFYLVLFVAELYNQDWYRALYWISATSITIAVLNMGTTS
jgi:hypothetical protein